LEKLRQPYKQLEAIYFVRPTPEAIRRIIFDLVPPAHVTTGRLYAGAHLYFISRLQDREFNQLKVSPANAFIKTIQELNVDYLPVEPNVFSVDRPWSFQTFYGKGVPQNIYDREQEGIAKQIASFCISLGEFPYIRFARVGDFEKLCGKTAALVYRELHQYAKIDRDYPANDEDLLGENRAQLVIVDRSIDKVSPFLHEFSYQAMASDLLNLTEGNP
jgi:syntaxin-binding protein 1